MSPKTATSVTGSCACTEGMMSPYSRRQSTSASARDEAAKSLTPGGRVVLAMRQLEVRLLGRFEVLVDSQRVPADAWAQRRTADLVKVLALAPGHRMPREELLELLWPHLAADAAASNLHKAASYARRALGDRGAVVLRSGLVELAPAAEVITDVERFERGDDS